LNDVPTIKARAAEGDREALYLLGALYLKGDVLYGIPKDNKRALELLRKAADLGQPRAQHAVGVHYEQGRLVKQDMAEAAKWYRKAADQGNPDAQYALGLMYMQGRGVKQDDEAAADWLGRAADLGVMDAQYHVGRFYLAGKGLPQDYAQAADWFERAAEQGHDEAQYALATLLIQGGPGLAQDRSQAYFWLVISSDTDNPANKIKRGALRDKIGRLLSLRMAQQIRQDAAEWKPAREKIIY
jgi:uncharacterized protein